MRGKSTSKSFDKGSLKMTGATESDGNDGGEV